MKNKKQKYTLEEINERQITPEELIAEIKPLLNDYFIGEITLDKNEILYRLPNGQSFTVTAKTA